MTVSADHERFMAMAIEEAKFGAAAGEQPFGAVISVRQCQKQNCGTACPTAEGIPPSY